MHSCNSYLHTFGTAALQQNNYNKKLPPLLLMSVYDSWECLVEVNFSTEYKEWHRRYSFNAGLNIFISWFKLLVLGGSLLDLMELNSRLVHSFLIVTEAIIWNMKVISVSCTYTVNVWISIQFFHVIHYEW
jgi:hypothetical protein